MRCWEPDFHVDGENGHINQYDHFLSTVRHAFAIQDIDGDKQPDTLTPAGIIWMQGESDAGDKMIAQRYQANLKRMMDLIHAALRLDYVRVVIGRISDSGKDDYQKDLADGKVLDFGDTVHSSQGSGGFCNSGRKRRSC